MWFYENWKAGEINPFGMVSKCAFSWHFTRQCHSCTGRWWPVPSSSLLPRALRWGWQSGALLHFYVRRCEQCALDSYSLYSHLARLLLRHEICWKGKYNQICECGRSCLSRATPVLQAIMVTACYWAVILTRNCCWSVCCYASSPVGDVLLLNRLQRKPFVRASCTDLLGETAAVMETVTGHCSLPWSISYRCLFVFLTSLERRRRSKERWLGGSWLLTGLSGGCLLFSKCGGPCSWVPHKLGPAQTLAARSGKKQSQKKSSSKDMKVFFKHELKLVQRNNRRLKYLIVLFSFNKIKYNWRGVFFFFF